MTDSSSRRQSLQESTLPRHVAIIMDGNGRWAEARGLPRAEGHRAGAESVRAVTRAAREVGIRVLTLYSFSAQNWERPAEEVATLMRLLADFLESERKEILENGIRLRAVGQLDRLPAFVRERLDALVADSAANQGMTLVLALSYGGREELLAAAAALQADGAPVTAESLQVRLWTAGLPDPDLVVRTSGERRISNFLLWQIAYAELYFTDTLWPDFRETALLDALEDFQRRERRFGRTHAQISGVP